MAASADEELTEQRQLGGRRAQPRTVHVDQRALLSWAACYCAPELPR